MSRCQKNALFYPTEIIPEKSIYYTIYIYIIYFFRIVGEKVNILTYSIDYQYFNKKKSTYS